MKIDFIIIGAGIVGLSTAYHLKNLNPNLNIVILEKENDLELKKQYESKIKNFQNQNKELEDVIRSANNEINEKIFNSNVSIKEVISKKREFLYLKNYDKCK